MESVTYDKHLLFVVEYYCNCFNAQKEEIDELKNSSNSNDMRDAINNAEFSEILLGNVLADCLSALVKDINSKISNKRLKVVFEDLMNVCKLRKDIYNKFSGLYDDLAEIVPLSDETMQKIINSKNTSEKLLEGLKPSELLGIASSLDTYLLFKAKGIVDILYMEQKQNKEPMCKKIDKAKEESKLQQIKECKNTSLVQNEI